MRGTARPPSAPARSQRGRRVAACERGDRLQALPLVVAVEGVQRSRDHGGSDVAEHAHGLVPERRRRQLEAVVVGRPAHQHELLVHARERRREEEAVALLLARALPRQAGRRERAPQLGRARGLGRLAPRQHAGLEPADDDGPHGREPGQAEAHDAHAPARQPVAEAHLHRVECRQHVLSVGIRQRGGQLVRRGGGRRQGAARRDAGSRLGRQRRRRRRRVRARRPPPLAAPPPGGSPRAARSSSSDRARRVGGEQFALGAGSLGDIARAQPGLRLVRRDGGSQLDPERRSQAKRSSRSPSDQATRQRLRSAWPAGRLVSRSRRSSATATPARSSATASGSQS